MAKCTRIIPTWIMVIENAPTLIMFILGAVLMGWTWQPLAAVYLAYCALSVVLFWALICSCCPHYDTRSCPCGYGIIAPRFFTYKSGRDFRKVFKKNIAIMYPCWFVPFAAGIYLLFKGFDAMVFGVFLAFCIVGFILVPVIAKLIGCRDCEIKDQCPWMSRGTNHS